MMRFILLFAAYVACATGKIVEYSWDVEWVTAAPDGFSRPVIGINGKWPCPTIEGTVGDTVVVNLNNKLGNESTSLHFHGISQKGSPEMDGASQVTQCPIPPGSLFTYSFILDAPGTYWYHSHNMGQYPDGLRGPLIVHDIIEPFPYDEEYVLTTSDWYHDQAPGLIKTMLSSDNPQALPPLPESFLLNDSQDVKLSLSPSKVYKIRVISMAALAATMFSFDSHTMRIIEIDGVYVDIHDATQIRVAPAQRYTFLLTAKATAKKNYAFTAALDTNRDFTVSDAIWPLNLTGYLVYDSDEDLPGDFIIDTWDKTLDDTSLVPLDHQGLLGKPDQIITYDFNFGTDKDGIPRAYLNGATYVSQKVPTLYSVLSTGKEATNPKIYGMVNPIVIKQGQIIEIVLNNLDAALHPFHLHGHKFQVITRPASGSGKYDGDSSGFSTIPMRRDTINVNGNSHVVLRFQADNPGVQLFHCHIEWHVNLGLTATFIEDPEHLQSHITIPEQHLKTCEVQGIPTKGNAAGNTGNLTDLSGINSQTPDNGALYTASGSKLRRAVPPMRMRWERPSA